jgi:polyhydroxyalkanoate synthesis regulator phasin
MARSVAKRRPVLGDLPKRVEKAQAEAEKRIRRGWKALMNAMPPRARKAAENLTARVEKAASRLEKRRIKALKRVEKAATDLDKRRHKALKRVEKQGKELVASFESRAADAVKPLVDRMDVAKRSDLEKLSRRISQLERKVTRRPSHKAAA